MLQRKRFALFLVRFSDLNRKVEKDYVLVQLKDYIISTFIGPLRCGVLCFPVVPQRDNSSRNALEKERMQLVLPQTISSLSFFFAQTPLSTAISIVWAQAL